MIGVGKLTSASSVMLLLLSSAASSPCDLFPFVRGALQNVSVVATTTNTITTITKKHHHHNHHHHHHHHHRRHYREPRPWEQTQEHMHGKEGRGVRRGGTQGALLDHGFALLSLLNTHATGIAYETRSEALPSDVPTCTLPSDRHAVLCHVWYHPAMQLTLCMFSCGVHATYATLHLLQMEGSSILLCRP